MHESDRALVAKMGAGDQRAFDEFFHSCAPRLAAFAARRSGLDAASVEDVVQNTLVKAIRNLGSYRGEAALFTWLTEICRHELADSESECGSWRRRLPAWIPNHAGERGEAGESRRLQLACGEV